VDKALDLGYADFRESGLGEVRRNPLPRTRVNKDKKEGRS
jgi:hypothetical protein